MKSKYSENNFWFADAKGKIYESKSERSIKEKVKDLGLRLAIINREKGYWDLGSRDAGSKTYTYKPRY